MDDEAFVAAVIYHWGLLFKLSRNDIADALLVSRPTFSRWLIGKNLPANPMRVSIVEQLKKLVAEGK